MDGRPWKNNFWKFSMWFPLGKDKAVGMRLLGESDLACSHYFLLFLVKN